LRTIIYLHGFRSSSASTKATQLAAFVAGLPPAERPALIIPDLPDRPARAIETIDARVAASGGGERVCFVGSSLGGFYATVAAERHGGRAVLVNPAVRPDEALRAYAGVQFNLHTGAAFQVTATHFDELRAMRVPRITCAARYWLLVETGDEVLDYREAVAFYAGAQQFVQGGGDHAYRGFVAQLPAILRFAGVPAIGIVHRT
jgi:predicted esterase YcpF (UPF0227 family)